MQITKLTNTFQQLKTDVHSLLSNIACIVLLVILIILSVISYPFYYYVFNGQETLGNYTYQNSMSFADYLDNLLNKFSKNE